MPAGIQQEQIRASEVARWLGQIPEGYTLDAGAGCTNLRFMDPDGHTVTLDLLTGKWSGDTVNNGGNTQGS